MASKHDDFFGGMFDFNGDGKTDIGEEFLAYMMFEEMSKKEKAEEEDDSDDLSISNGVYLFDDDEDQDFDNGEDNFVFSSPSVRPQTYRAPAQASPASKVDTHPIPEHPTLAQYREHRGIFLSELVVGILLTAGLCVIPGIVIWAAISSYDGKNSASGFVVSLFVIAGITAFCVILKAAASTISSSYSRFRQVKERYLENATEEEVTLQKKKKRKTVILLFSILGAGILTLIAVAAVNTSRTASVYNEALNQIGAGSYEHAAVTLQQIEKDGYKDTKSLLLLCEAHKEYDSGRAIDAYYTMQDARFYHIPADQTEKIDSFRKTLQSEYDAYIHEQAERSRKEYERIQSLPFPSVGQYVTKSQLDQMHWEGNDNKTCDVHTTKYLYTSGGGEKYRLWISDYNCIKKVVKLLSSHSSSPSTGKSGTGGLNNEPSVDGFSHPEDFYDWYWDDFFDYEDAEDYYYSHGGK